jgi:hypothetical protein
MLRRSFLTLSILCWSCAALAGAVVDATGRSVDVPAQIARVLPAGPPAAILLSALAPELMLGWLPATRTASRVICTRSIDDANCDAGTDLAETFDSSAGDYPPPRSSPSRQASLDDTDASIPCARCLRSSVRTTLAQSDAARSRRAVRDGRVLNCRT